MLSSLCPHTPSPSAPKRTRKLKSTMEQTHIAILPTPGTGHLIPLIELARKLIQLHNFAVTFIIPDDGISTKKQKAILETSPSINSIFLPPASTADLPDDIHIEARILLCLIRSTPSLCNVLTELKESGRLSAFLVDLFGAFTFNTIKGLGVPLYVFFPCTAVVLSFTLHLPQLDGSCSCEYRDLTEPIKLPGCLPIHGLDLTDSVQDRNSETYKLCLELCRNFTLAEGILVNSFLNLEPDTFKALEQGGWSPVYPIGPLVRPCSSDISGDKVECLKWLDEQPAGSVLFVSFGSGGTLSTNQLKELAVGLEVSEQRFLLVARRPNDEIRNAAYFVGSENNTDPFDYLPSGFVERSGGKGFVVPEWAPQIEVLSHPSVGGFLTHCGWNSTLESIVHGVPMIAWPLFAEQRMNAVLLSEGLKVALRVRENENGVVDSEQISSLVRSLMGGAEGEELRNRMGNLKDAAGKALWQDGFSTKSLANVAEKWKSEETAP